MLKNAFVYPTIPVTDLQKAKEFYEETLGLAIVMEVPTGVIFRAGKDSQLYIYQRGPSKADHTLAGFVVEDIEATIDELTGKGVVFEQYDYPGLKTDEKGIALQGPVKAAWFKDIEGNILGIIQYIK